MLPDRDLPRLGLRQHPPRVLAQPAQVMQSGAGRLVRVRGWYGCGLPPLDARRLGPRPGWHLPLPLDQLALARCAAHF